MISDLKLNFILKFEHLRILTNVSKSICFVYQILYILNKLMQPIKIIQVLSRSSFIKHGIDT